MVRAMKDSKTFDALSLLKKHLRSCRTCIAAKKTGDPYAMCLFGITQVWKAAWQYDDLIRLRTAAHSDTSGVVYACPDLSKHGADYSLTASPLVTIGLQDRLF